MEDQFKRLNSLTSEPFESGFHDESGRIFIRYLTTQGNDGYYFEEWAKNKEAYLKKINKI